MWACTQASDRSDIHDRSAAPAAKRTEGQLRREHHRAQIDVQHALPLLDGCFGIDRVVDAASVVHEHVETAADSFCPFDHPLQLVVVRHVRTDEESAEIGRCLLAGFGVLVGEDDVGARLHQCLGDGEADPHRGAGHERHFSGELHGVA